QYHSAIGFYSYSGLLQTPQDFTCRGSNCTVNQGPWYYQGPHSALAPNFDSSYAQTAGHAIMMGIMTNNQAMIDAGKKLVIGFITLAVNNIGAMDQYNRWGVAGCT